MAQPRYTADGQLILPSDYREWVFLSSGLGMTYNPPNTPGHANGSVIYQCVRQSRCVSFFPCDRKVA